MSRPGSGKDFSYRSGKSWYDGFKFIQGGILVFGSKLIFSSPFAESILVQFGTCYRLEAVDWPDTARFDLFQMVLAIMWRTRLTKTWGKF